MKKSMFALVAIMAASFASAVAVTWTDANWQTMTEGPMTITREQQGTVGLVATMTGSTTARGAVFAFGGGVKYVYVSHWDGLWYASFEGREETSTTVNPAVEAGKAIIGISMTRSDSAFTTLEVSVNGTVLLSLTEAVADGGAFWMYQYSVGQNLAGGSKNDASFASTDDIKLFHTTEVLTAEQIAALPEPTVLALLALGVGAIALKRKVA